MTSSSSGYILEAKEVAVGGGGLTSPAGAPSSGLERSSKHFAAASMQQCFGFFPFSLKCSGVDWINSLRIWLWKKY